MIEWDKEAIALAVALAERQVKAQMKPVLESRVDGAFALEETPTGFAVGPEGVAAEYAGGTSWAVSTLAGATYGGQ